jgi:hypothetical protein
MRAKLTRLRVVVHGDYADGTTEQLREQEFRATCYLCDKVLQNQYGYVSASLLGIDDGGLVFICAEHNPDALKGT